MPRYMVSIEVKAQRLPDAPEDPVVRPSEDPMAAVANMAKSVFSGSPVMMAMPSRPAGIEMSRNITVNAESFASLAAVLGAFDNLAERLECEYP